MLLGGRDGKLEIVSALLLVNQSSLKAIRLLFASWSSITESPSALGTPSLQVRRPDTEQPIARGEFAKSAANYRKKNF
jgi:hypothetical protein